MKRLAYAAAILLYALASPQAEEAAPELLPFTPSFDQQTLQRGARVFVQTCMMCHSARYLQWRHLIEYKEIGMTREEVDELRGDAPLIAPLRTVLSAEDARASYGTVPPDLSLIARAREGGARYLYSLLLGYAHDPEGKVPDGNYNLYFPGHRIAMPDPLGWLDHAPEDEARIRADAAAVASFLAFIGEPHQLERVALGKKVMIYLVLLAIVLGLLNREVWREVKK